MKKKPRWGHVRQIDYRTKVGTSAWRRRHPRNIQKLSAWRYLHLQQSHSKVSRRAGVKPSSNMKLRRMLVLAGVK